MAQEAVIHGAIVCPAAPGDPREALMADTNAEVVSTLPQLDHWPWLTRSMFALPAGFPQGSYRSQVIHIGLSIKGRPNEPQWLDPWLDKFEGVLRRCYWVRARLIVEPDDGDAVLVHWTPSADALRALQTDPPTPVGHWLRTEELLGG